MHPFWHIKLFPKTWLTLSTCNSTQTRNFSLGASKYNNLSLTLLLFFSKWKASPYFFFSKWNIMKCYTKFETLLLIRKLEILWQVSHGVEPNKMLPTFGHQKLKPLTDCICTKGRYFIPMVDFIFLWFYGISLMSLTWCYWLCNTFFQLSFVKENKILGQKTYPYRFFLNTMRSLFPF